MNINCPHCSAYLTVPEQYAGQLMKCPKCSSNFTVPALPAIDHDPAFATSPSPSVPAPASSGSPSLEPPIPLAPEVPAFNLAPPEPAFATSPPPPVHATPVHATPASSAPPRSTTTPVRTSPVGMTRTCTLPLPLKVLQWIPLGAAVLLFILQFFPWVGVYPGGIAAVTQDAWQIAFGTYTADPDMKDIFTIRTEAEARTINDKHTDGNKVVHNEPGKSPLMIFYLLPFFILTLLVSIAVAVLPFLHLNLPPAVANLLPWRWAILAVLNLLLLLFLGLYLVLNFSLESSVKEWARNKAELQERSDGTPKKADDLGTKERKMQDARRGMYEEWLQRTIWWKLALLIHILSTLASCLVYWMDKHHVPEVHAEAGLRW